MANSATWTFCVYRTNVLMLIEKKRIFPFSPCICGFLLLSIQSTSSRVIYADILFYRNSLLSCLPFIPFICLLGFRTQVNVINLSIHRRIFTYPTHDYCFEKYFFLKPPTAYLSYPAKQAPPRLFPDTTYEVDQEPGGKGEVLRLPSKILNLSTFAFTYLWVLLHIHVYHTQPNTCI